MLLRPQALITTSKTVSSETTAEKETHAKRNAKQALHKVEGQVLPENLLMKD